METQAVPADAPAEEQPLPRFLTARVERQFIGVGDKTGNLKVTLYRREGDFKGEPEVLAVSNDPYDSYLEGRVREALLTLGITREEECVGRTTGLAVALRDPDPRRG